MAKKKDPINVTPQGENNTLINPDRIKIVVLFNGDNVITDLQEAVDKTSNVRQAYIFNFPYKVEYERPSTKGTTGLIEDPEVKVHYSPWCPLSTETKIAINHNMVVTILEPVPSLRETYMTNVRQMGGSIA
jgi:hypothetical protein|tara:strand:+ start:1401 stop:1793 length:393 start_codon:yes stop_codon:yes gene_type:complete